MAKSKAPLHRGEMEGHGDSSPQPSVTKGTYMPVGSAVNETMAATKSPISPNKKTGTASGGEAGGVH